MKQLLVHQAAWQQVVAKTLTPYTGTGGLYSSMTPTDISKLEILNLCSRLGIPVTEEEEFHCTIIYSPDKTPEQGKVIRNLSPGPATAVVVGFDIFGPEKDHLVMTLASPDMAKLHHKWKALGCESTWPDYRPHVSIAKGNAFDPDKIISATAWILNNEPVTLEFLPEQVEDIS